MTHCLSLFLRFSHYDDYSDSKGADDDFEKFDHLSSTFSNDNDDILDIVIFLRN